VGTPSVLVLRECEQREEVHGRLITREIQAKSVLSRSGIDGISYCINPYVGCAHGCTYCYASFMKRFTGHAEPWGSFVDAKVNSPALLEKQLKKFRGGKIFVSSATDPYQPAESHFRLTRDCLAALSDYPYQVTVLTKSPLVLRDIDVLQRLRNIRVGLTVTTDNDEIRRLFEPAAPSIKERVETLKALSGAGISTYAFIGPVLPMNPDRLAESLGPYVESVIIDRMNYRAKTRSIYRRHGIEEWLTGSTSDEAIDRLRKALSSYSVEGC
jgi:DNA repair photolyase